MKRHSFLTLLAVLMVTVSAPAVETALAPAEVQKLLEETSGRYQAVTSLETAFTQVRTTRLLKEPATTRGRFFFKKPDRLLWEFTEPYRIKLFYEQNAVVKVDLKRKTYAKLNVRKYREPMLDFLNITKAMDFLDKYFIIKEIDTKLEDIYIIFIPKKRRVKKRVRLVEAWLDADTYLFRRIKVTEKDGTITELTFHDTQINQDIPDDIFHVNLDGFRKEKWQN